MLQKRFELPSVLLLFLIGLWVILTAFWSSIIFEIFPLTNRLHFHYSRHQYECNSFQNIANYSRTSYTIPHRPFSSSFMFPSIRRKLEIIQAILSVKYFFYFIEWFVEASNKNRIFYNLKSSDCSVSNHRLPYKWVELENILFGKVMLQKCLSHLRWFWFMVARRFRS